MEFLHLLSLSVVQGLTEFLPVSSSGHLALFPQIFGMTDQGILIDVALHVGTLLAIIVYYHRDVWHMCFSVLTWNTTTHNQDRLLAIYIIIATIPAVIAGLLVHHFFPDGIRSIHVIIVTLIGFGLLMGWADKKCPQENDIKNISLKQMLIVGVAQAVALIPGTSRSGITMTAARFLGFKRVDAARISFLLGMPAMAGARLLSFLEVMETGDMQLLQDAVMSVVLAFFAGLFAIHVMMTWLKKSGLMPFVIYRVFLGLYLLVQFVILG